MKNKKLLLSWLITGIILIIFSIVVLFYAFTNNKCQIGPAVCGGERIGAYTGISLGIFTIIMSFYCSHGDNQPQSTPQNINRRRGLVIFGSSLIIMSIIMAIIGLSSKTLNRPGAMTPGFAMVILAIPIVLAGIIITSLGIYNLKNKEKTNGIPHPVITSIFIIGIIAMIFLLFF